MSTQKAVIETSFAKDSGYGNPVFSKFGSARNADHINALFGPKKALGNVGDVDIDTIQQPCSDTQASRDLLMQDSTHEDNLNS